MPPKPKVKSESKPRSKIAAARKRHKAQTAKLKEELELLGGKPELDFTERVRKGELEYLVEKEKRDQVAREKAISFGLEANSDWALRGKLTRLQKDDRRAAIRHIVGANLVPNRSALIRLLGEAGFSVSETVLARDLRELHARLYKPTPNDPRRYVLLEPDDEETSAVTLIEYELGSRVAFAVEEVDRDGKMVFVQCVDKMAAAVTDTLREYGWPDVRSILNDSSTIWVWCADERTAREVETVLRKHVLLGS